MSTFWCLQFWTNRYTTEETIQLLHDLKAHCQTINNQEVELLGFTYDHEYFDITKMPVLSVFIAKLIPPQIIITEEQEEEEQEEEAMEEEDEQQDSEEMMEEDDDEIICDGYKIHGIDQMISSTYPNIYEAAYSYVFDGWTFLSTTW